MKKFSLLIAVLVLALGLVSRRACAYNDDVHFNLTYVLCRMAGLPLKDALWIALADQSMDDNEQTSAFNGNIDAIEQAAGIKQEVWQRNGRDWHAFSSKGGEETLLAGLLSKRGRRVHYYHVEEARSDILTRRNVLQQRVFASLHLVANTDNTHILQSEIALGQFLHYEQDYFSHRQLTLEAVNNVKYLPYGPFFGHSADNHDPDYVGARPELAGLMIEDSYKCIRLFAAKSYGRDLRPEMPHSALQSIINGLAAHGYHYYPDIHPTGLFGSPQPYLRVKQPPTQKETNSALSSALQALHLSGPWVTHLPCYAYPDDSGLEYSKARHPFVLPYDNPKAPLIAMKNRVDALIEIEHLSETQGPVSLVGEWSSNWGPLEIKPDYTGSWRQGGQIGKIKDSTYDPNTRKFVFHYYQPWNRMNGTATMTLSEDENTLSGEYIQNGGFAPSGSWTMTRDPKHAEERETRVDSVVGTWAAPKKMPAPYEVLSQLGYFDLNRDLTGSWFFQFKDANRNTDTQITDVSYDAKQRCLTFHTRQPKKNTSGRAILFLSDDETTLSGTYDQTNGMVAPGEPTPGNPNGLGYLTTICIFMRPFSAVLSNEFLKETGQNNPLLPPISGP